MNRADVSLANDFARARDLRNELRKLEESIARRADRSPITEADERRMTDMQARADEAYTSAGRRAPPPLPLERPDEYRRRLADGVKTYSPRFREIDLSGVVDEGLDVIERQIYADAITHGRTYGLGAKQIRPMPSRTDAGHSTVEFVGGPEASFVRHFERPARRAIFKTPQEYSRMAHDANMSRLNEIIRQRPVPQTLRTGF